MNKKDLSFRPATNKLIKSIFDIIRNYEFKNNKFLDLFSGSGRVCIEAYKQGFDVTAIELNKQRYIKMIKLFKSKNYPIDLINMDAQKYLQHSLTIFDIIYIDPPYSREDLYNKTLELIFANNLIENSGIVIIEKSKRISLQFDYEKYNHKNYCYGDTELIVIKNE